MQALKQEWGPDKLHSKTGGSKTFFLPPMTGLGLLVLGDGSDVVSGPAVVVLINPKAATTGFPRPKEINLCTMASDIFLPCELRISVTKVWCTSGITCRSIPIHCQSFTIKGTTAANFRARRKPYQRTLQKPGYFELHHQKSQMTIPGLSNLPLVRSRQHAAQGCEI